VRLDLGLQRRHLRFGQAPLERGDVGLQVASRATSSALRLPPASTFMPNEMKITATTG
jgi:hypothetical protein